MTSEQRELVAQRLAKLLIETELHTQMVSNGDMTLAQSNEITTEYVEHQRAEMTEEQYAAFFEGVGRLAYWMNQEMSALGRPLPGNDTRNPN